MPVRDSQAQETLDAHDSEQQSAGGSEGSTRSAAHRDTATTTPLKKKKMRMVNREEGLTEGAPKGDVDARGISGADSEGEMGRSTPRRRPKVKERSRGGETGGDDVAGDSEARSESDTRASIPTVTRDVAGRRNTRSEEGEGVDDGDRDGELSAKKRRKKSEREAVKTPTRDAGACGVDGGNRGGGETAEHLTSSKRKGKRKAAYAAVKVEGCDPDTRDGRRDSNMIQMASVEDTRGEHTFGQHTLGEKAGEEDMPASGSKKRKSKHRRDPADKDGHTETTPHRHSTKKHKKSTPDKRKAQEQPAIFF